MPASQALAVPVHGVQRSLLILLTFLASIALAVLGTASAAHAEGDVPEKPENLLYVTEDAEVSTPDLDTITSLMDGLNGAHDEQVGILITDADADPQDLSKQALKDWGLSKDGAIIVITTKDQGVGLSVGTNLTDRVTPEDQDDVVNKVAEGIGEYGDWATGIQSGATRLFLYIEDQGLGGGTDVHDHEGESDGHTHAADDPAAEEVPEGEAPDDAYVESETQGEDPGLSDTTKVVIGSVVVVAAGVGLFFLVRNARRKTGAKETADGASDDTDAKDETDEE